MSYQNNEDGMKLKSSRKRALVSVVVLLAIIEWIPSISANQTSAVDESTTGIVWGECTSSKLQSAGAECGFLSVPLDHSQPNGTTIQLAISRVKHNESAAKFQGILLVNPGGPGGSGLDYVSIRKTLPEAVSLAYDWIGFDPRGVGSSQPVLSCLPGYFAGPRPNYIPSDIKLRRFWLKHSRSYALACAQNNPELLKHMATINTVKDMESIRVALGRGRINFYGYGYGTYLGQIYSTLYPKRVRRMVLDANVDPRHVWFKANLEEDLVFEHNTRRWFRWVAKHHSVYGLGKTQQHVAKRWRDSLEQLQTNPANGIIGPAEWADVFLSAALARFIWPSLANAFSLWANQNNSDALVSMYLNYDTPGNDITYAAYLATTCTDAPWPRSGNYIRRENRRTFSKAPLFTWQNAWFNGPCQYWPEHGRTRVNVNGSEVDAILLIGEITEAAAVFRGNFEIRRRFPRARLIGIPGIPMNPGNLYGNECVNNLVAKYLHSGGLPARKTGDHADLVCSPLPRPVPTAMLEFANKDIANLPNT